MTAVIQEVNGVCTVSVVTFAGQCGRWGGNDPRHHQTHSDEDQYGPIREFWTAPGNYMAHMCCQIYIHIYIYIHDDFMIWKCLGITAPLWGEMAVTSRFVSHMMQNIGVLFVVRLKKSSSQSFETPSCSCDFTVLTCFKTKGIQPFNWRTILIKKDVVR